jgi:FtsP/CotA-like multicopper oxidase with cupredoxin domain
MKLLENTLRGMLLTSSVSLACFGTQSALAVVDGVQGPTFNLTAKADYLTLGDGSSMLAWGYANDTTGQMQYPGVTMIVNQGDTVTVNLKNSLSKPVSIVFPGQEGVVASGGAAGLLTNEAPADGGVTTVTYTFTATHAGTYQYYSGTQTDLQTEMGLVGALIVRPSGGGNRAYAHANTAFDHEYLFLTTEADPVIHGMVEAGQYDLVDMSTYHPVLWFFNGRNGPDTMAGVNVPWMPTQPYNCLPRMHPGEKLLMRVVNAGRDLHPFHHHGNNALMIAKDGRVLESTPGAGPDLAASDFTVRTIPGETNDLIFEWTGKGLGWDMYGHKAGDALQPNEYAADHTKPFPVILPNTLDLTVGGSYGGGPYLGTFGVLPPGQGGFNPTAGYFFMWHSHTERELTNNDIFPGGMMTMLIIEPWNVTIP